MSEYQRVDVRPLALRATSSAEERYWKAIKPAKVHKHYVKIAHLAFSPTEPHYLATCASTKVTLYDPVSLEPSKSITRFQDVSLCSSFRPDGKLIAASDQKGMIQIFDLSSRMILRSFTGHEGPVWSVSMCNNFSRLYSGGDDRTVRQWDITSQSCLRTFNEHSDYVRHIGLVDNEPDLIVSGGLDGLVKYWDPRCDDTEACVLTVNHGTALTAMCCVPTSAALSYSLLTASEASVKAFDTRHLRSQATISSSQSDLSESVFSTSPHQKSITSMCLDATNSRILTASLDTFIKVTSAQSFNVVASLKYGTPLLCMALSPDNSTIATGTADGALTIRQRVVSDEPIAKPDRAPRPGSRNYFARGIHSAVGDTDYQVDKERKARLRPYDVHFKKFQYHAALDTALRTADAPVIVAVLDELCDRQAVQIALSNRTDVMLAPLLSFLASYVSHPHYATLCLDIIGAVLTMYSPMAGTSVLFDEWCSMMAERVQKEVATQQQAMQAKGSLEALWSASLALSNEANTTPIPASIPEVKLTDKTIVDSSKKSNKRQKV